MEIFCKCGTNARRGVLCSSLIYIFTLPLFMLLLFGLVVMLICSHIINSANRQKFNSFGQRAYGYGNAQRNESWILLFFFIVNSCGATTHTQLCKNGGDWGAFNAGSFWSRHAQRILCHCGVYGVDIEYGTMSQPRKKKQINNIRTNGLTVISFGHSKLSFSVIRCFTATTSRRTHFKCCSVRMRIFRGVFFLLAIVIKYI